MDTSKNYITLDYRLQLLDSPEWEKLPKLEPLKLNTVNNLDMIVDMYRWFYEQEPVLSLKEAESSRILILPFWADKLYEKYKIAKEISRSALEEKTLIKNISHYETIVAKSMLDQLGIYRYAGVIIGFNVFVMKKDYGIVEKHALAGVIVDCEWRFFVKRELNYPLRLEHLV